MTAEFNTGQHIGDYEILSILGLGGMGKVYKVRNLISDRVEAMKILLPDLTSQQSLADRFLREIRLLATLSHPNIAALRTALTYENQLVMIMEFVEGETLANRLARAPISTAEAVNYSDQILSALSYAHKQNIIHRDIKPANMMLTPQGVVKLMDFGIARSSSDGALTTTGTTLGSLNYMPPEQVRGEAGRRALGHLFVWGVALRNDDGQAAVSRRFAVLAYDGAPEYGATLADFAAQRSAAGSQRDYSDGHGEGTREPLPDCRRISERAEERAGFRARFVRHDGDANAAAEAGLDDNVGGNTDTAACFDGGNSGAHSCGSASGCTGSAACHGGGRATYRSAAGARSSSISFAAWAVAGHRDTARRGNCDRGGNLCAAASADSSRSGEGHVVRRLGKDPDSGSQSFGESCGAGRGDPER